MNDIEFRSVTLTAFKPEQTDANGGGCDVIYRGPFAAVTDDSGNTYLRGQRTAVSSATGARLANTAYSGAFINTAETGDAAAGCCTPENNSGNSCC